MIASAGSDGSEVSPCWRLCLVLGVVLTLSSGLAYADAAAQSPVPEPDNTVTEVEALSNGSAVWSVTVRTRLNSTERVEEYEAFQRRFRDNTSRYLNPFSRRMTGVVSAASGETGREMEARGFRASTGVQEVPRRWGYVTYGFLWTGFAEETEGGLLVGDVLQGGFYLSDGDRLEIHAPEGYSVVEVSPEPDERAVGAVQWTGREDFGDDEPSVELRESEDGGATPSSTSVAALVALALLGVVAYAAVRRRDRADEAGEGVRSAAADDEDGADGGGSPPVADSERVVELLESNGGRMRQASIGEELGWSDSKTSRMLGKMEDEGEVEKLRMGRENVVDLRKGG